MLTMAEGGTPRSPFLGFAGTDLDESVELKHKFEMIRMKALEENVHNLLKRVADLEKERNGWMTLEKKLTEVNKENDKLREENESLKKQLEKEMREVRQYNEEIQTTVRGVEKKQASLPRQRCPR